MVFRKSKTTEAEEVKASDQGLHCTQYCDMYGATLVFKRSKYLME